MRRLSDYKIKTRLYGLVVDAVIGFTAVLGTICQSRFGLFLGWVRCSAKPG